MTTPDRITLRLGTLAEAIYAAAAKSGRSVSDEIRYRLARSLRVAAPEMKPGNPSLGQESAKGLTARWHNVQG